MGIVEVIVSAVIWVILFFVLGSIIDQFYYNRKQLNPSWQTETIVIEAILAGFSSHILTNVIVSYIPFA